MNYIGIDNGTTGSIGIIADDGNVLYVKTPVYETLNYTKQKQFIKRIDTNKFYELMVDYSNNAVCFMERPMVNGLRFKASLLAVRAHEAIETILNRFPIVPEIIDSRKWQKLLLPEGLKKEELKKASLMVGKKLFPKLDFTGFEDADGLLIAEYCRRIRK